MTDSAGTASRSSGSGSDRGSWSHSRRPGSRRPATGTPSAARAVAAGGSDRTPAAMTTNDQMTTLASRDTWANSVVR